MIDYPQQQKAPVAPVLISIVISQKNGLPCLELRKNTSDTKLIQAIITSAFHNRPMILQPQFSDRFKAIATLVEKGIIYREGDKYLFVV